MKKGGSKSCKSASHQLFKDKAKNRVEDLHGMFNDLQYARKESRTGDVTVLEEQVNQMLREWKAELNEPSPASSLLGGSLGSFSTDICRLLQRCEEEDDATSVLAEPANPKPDPDAHGIPAADTTSFQQDYFVNNVPEEHGFQGVDPCKGSASEMQTTLMHNLDLPNQFDYPPFDLHQDFDHNLYVNFNGNVQCGEDTMHQIPDLLPSISVPPSAFLGPKCALWDCPRPAQGSDWFHDYCSNYHAALALNEGPPGMSPVLRPGGIGLKDGPLFASLNAKTQGKDVGIPECEGAATTKSPWNAPELFDLSFFEGETIREWLFFDKPRRAFESGTRKQRSLPDYSGRGWHESRKQVMKEFGGLKRSYYMDPQPLNRFEWHLYEYEINNCDLCALYRLELKLVDGKKSPKGKVANDPLADLQKQMGRLTAEFPTDNKRSVKSRTKINPKDDSGDVFLGPNQMGPTSESFGYGVNAPYSYLVENLSDLYGT
ncbi:Transcription factor voz1 [Ranunculus cassubicifolius]